MQNTMKFAVAHMLGDEVTILKLFEEDQKEAAMAYGQQAAQEYDTGLICLIKAAFTPEGERADDRYRLYEAYEHL